MTKPFRLTTPAKLDTDDLILRIAEDDWLTALRIDDELEAAFDLLAARPFIGHRREDLGVPPTFRVWHSAKHKPKL